MPHGFTCHGVKHWAIIEKNSDRQSILYVSVHKTGIQEMSNFGNKDSLQLQKQLPINFHFFRMNIRAVECSFQSTCPSPKRSRDHDLAFD